MALAAKIIYLKTDMIFLVSMPAAWIKDKGWYCGRKSELAINALIRHDNFPDRTGIIHRITRRKTILDEGQKGVAVLSE